MFPPGPGESLPQCLLKKCPVSRMLLASFAKQCDTQNDIAAFRHCFNTYFNAVEISKFDPPSFRLAVALVMTIKFIGVDNLSPVKGVLSSNESRRLFGHDVNRRVALAECRALFKLISPHASVVYISKTTPGHLPSKTTPEQASPDTHLICTEVLSP
jgi:hypothetical protein